MSLLDFTFRIVLIAQCSSPECTPVAGPVITGGSCVATPFIGNWIGVTGNILAFDQNCGVAANAIFPSAKKWTPFNSVANPVIQFLNAGGNLIDACFYSFYGGLRNRLALACDSGRLISLKKK